MVKRQGSSALVEQVISKLLDYRSEDVPKDSCLLQLLQPTTQNSPNYADTRAKGTVQAAWQWEEWRRKNSPLAERTAKKTKGIVLVLVAWILLVLNVLAVVGSLKCGPNLAKSSHAMENTNSFLFQMGVLAFGAFVLSWTTWLCLKGRTGGIVAVQLIIIMALSVTFASVVKKSGDVTTGITNIRGLGRTLLCSFSTSTPVTTTPMYQLVTGILYSEDKPSAVFGDQTVHEGDTLYGINVVKIYKDKVEFEKNGKRWTQSVENKLWTY